MKNVTIAIEEATLKAAREYAKRHGVSLNALIRRLLEQTVCDTSDHWVDECFELMDKAGGRSGGRRWRRDELYDV
jgi:hypothetical protein